MKKEIHKIIVIVGPTASGKSDLAIKIAKKYGGEIISADSRQVYRGMDIGTGKVSKKEQKTIPHHLIDVISPKRTFTVAQFKKLGEKALNEIVSKDKIPVVVGGTGFYIDVLLGRISVAEVPPDKKLRAELKKQSAEQLFKRLEKLDPKRTKTIEPKNKRRLIRALEIVLTTGKPVPLTRNLKPITYNISWLGLRPKNLEQKIKKRLDARLKQGMTKEVKNLLKSGVSKKRLYEFGLEYKWLTRYLNKEVSYEEMKGGLLRDIIKYSKRQMTWFTRPNFVERNLGGFKRNPEIKWVKNQKEAEKLLQSFL